MAWMQVVMLGIMGVALLSGCEQPTQRLNAPPQGQTDQPSELQDTWVRMTDSALLTERSISPTHFVPGTTELNSVGVRRLNRYATLLKVYGGPLHYDGMDDEEAFAKQRVDRIKDYLVATGLGPDLFTVDTGLAGGTEMRADEAGNARAGTTAVSLKSESRSVDRGKRDIIESDGGQPSMSK
jgi:hypothetical protein